MFALDTDLFTASAFPRILVINDKPEMRTILEHGLGNLGFEVQIVSNARVVTEAVKGWMPEAIVVDAHLFGGDAFSLVASLRRITEVPILMLSGPSESEHRVRALTCGADDYIAAPFDWEEVAAYIRARLRRPRMEKRDVIAYADVAIDVTRRKAARAGNPLDLSARV